MSNLSDNYYSREYFLKTKQVPTISLISNRMGKPLANVYFKSMSYEHKVVAGLEPPLKGGGSDWYMPPEEMLKGKVVFKPEKNENLAKLGSDGLIHFGELLIKQYFQSRKKERQQALIDADIKRKQTAEVAYKQHFEVSSKEAETRNTKEIQKAFNQFVTMLITSTAKIENLLFDSSFTEIKRIKQEASNKMEVVLKERIEYQAKKLYDRYTNKLYTKKNLQKDKFLKKLEYARAFLAAEIHDIRMEKYLVVERLRHYLQSQNLACRLYVALKERDECKAEIERSELEHKRKIKELKEQLAMRDYEIILAREKKQKREEFITIWKKKVCEVVKKFQMFVTFCLTSLPEYADFFIDMEKLMLFHLNVAFENPQAENMFEEDKEESHTPIPKSHPFYLMCDKDNKPKIEEDLCPKHCTSSASHMPVVVVNKRCIYASCDNFQQFTSKIADFIHGHQGDDIDFEDQHDYELDVPVKYTSKEQLQELKLESSLLQIIQKERPNLHSPNLQCCTSNIPICFSQDVFSEARRKALSQGVYIDAATEAETAKESKAEDTTSMKSAKSTQPSVKHPTPSEVSISSGSKMTREDELKHEREPKIGNYLKYIRPMRCKCAITAKKHLAQILPPYMVAMSKYEELEMPNYEKCPVEVLKKLVKKAQRKLEPVLPPEIIPTSRDMATQYSDQQFDALCTCFSDDSMKAFLKGIEKGTTQAKEFITLDGDITPSILRRGASSFATECAYELRRVMEGSPDLQEIFKKKDCKYDE